MTTIKTCMGVVLVLASFLECIGCNSQGLAPDVASVRVVPLPTLGQTTLIEPPGIDLGRVPLYSDSAADFRVDNNSTALLTLYSVDIIDTEASTARLEMAIDGERVRQWPVTLRATQAAKLRVYMRPQLDQEVARVKLRIVSDAGKGNVRSESAAIVTGTGNFIGEPRLEISYGGHTYPVPEQCMIQSDSSQECALPVLDFGAVPLQSSAMQSITLRNRPSAGTCLRGPLPDGSADCSATCVLQIAPNAAAWNIGLGFASRSSLPFGIVGNVAIPYELAAPDLNCQVARDGYEPGAVNLLIAVRTSDAETELSDILQIETNANNARRVQIPVHASARTGPVAIAHIRTCDESTHPTAPDHCTPDAAIVPLSRLFVDGSQSYDPAQPDNPNAIVSYHWELIESPAGVENSQLAWQGQETSLASLWVPVAGHYRLRLQVTNSIGLRSSPSSQSDIEFDATSNARLQIQLVWNDPNNDLDLHAVLAEGGDRVFGALSDCFWRTCQPATCTELDSCSPVLFDADSAPFIDGNPRLDIDDTNGLGPENINIDDPQPGHIRIYAHYYGLVAESESPTQATVRIMIDGYIAAEYQRVLRRNDLWYLGDVSFNDDETENITVATPDAPGQVGRVVHVPTIAYPAGIPADVLF